MNSDRWPPSALIPPPLRETDLLAQDSPVPRQRLRWLTHPLTRLLLMAVLTAGSGLLAIGLIPALRSGSAASLAWTQIAVVGASYLVLVLGIEAAAG